MGACQGQQQTPQCPPPAVTEELLVSTIEPHVAQHKCEPVHGGDVMKNVDGQKHHCSEHLDEETLWQGVTRVARGIAEDEVVGDNQIGQQDDRHQVRVQIHPLKGVVDEQHLVTGKIKVVIEHALVGDACQIIDNHTQHGDDGQHLDGRETHLLLAADVVADEVAGTQKELHQRVQQRAVVQAPYLADALQHALPRDGPHVSLLRTDGTEIAHKLVAAVDTLMRRLALAAGPVVKRGQLPLPESPVCCF